MATKKVNEYVDLRDLEHFGLTRNSFRTVDEKELKGIKKDAKNWLADNRARNKISGDAPKGLKRFTGPRFLIVKGKQYIHLNHMSSIWLIYKKHQDYQLIVCLKK